jgi:hypothetical protein
MIRLARPRTGQSPFNSAKGLAGDIADMWRPKPNLTPVVVPISRTPQAVVD